MTVTHVSAWLLVCTLFGMVPALAQESGHTGVVVDELGGVIANARLTLRSPQGALMQLTTTAFDGTFVIDSIPRGEYWLEVDAPSFQQRRMSLSVDRAGAQPLRIVLDVGTFTSEVTVTPERGGVADVDQTTAFVTVRRGAELDQQPLPTLGHALNGAPGIMVQASGSGQVSPFLRGLTGYHVLNLIDGVRFNNATFRSGPNQYLAFVDPGQADRVEAMLGPASSQYGSDALGGAIQLLTPLAEYRDGPGFGVRLEANLLAASADTSRAAEANVLVAGPRLSWSVGGARRRVDELRAGGGRDSHHVFRRFFGLSDDQIGDIAGDRQKDTSFTRSALHTKLAARVADRQNLTLWYQQSDLDGVRGSKDLWGGLGRLRSDFTPQRLQFFYTRYETVGVGAFDSLSATFSVNSQDDGSVRQGLRPTDRITRDEVGVNAFGYAGQATTHVGSRHAIVFGGEIYDERIDARREEYDPRTGLTDQRRALYPNGSIYRTGGVFVQDAIDLVRDADGSRLRASLSGRFTNVGVRTYSDDNRDSLGRGLGVVDSQQSYRDWTFTSGLTWDVTRTLSIHGLAGRGFRAPNLNDLGALGLNDLGYEVPANATIDAGGLIGASDGEGVLPNGRGTSPLTAERLFNFEVGAALRWRRLYARAHVFDAELKDPIVRRTLLFPADRAPNSLAGVAVTALPQTPGQREQGVVSVATALDPRAVKAFVNEGQSRYYGVDAQVRYHISPRWTAAGTYSYLVGHELNPTRPVRRLPPQHGFLALRYQPGGRIPWVEASAHLSGTQDLLSGGDVTDERIGAARRRSDITDFFLGGLVSPFLQPGADGRLGSADDVFAPTNETLAQIRDRVLPVGATINGVTVADDGTRVPLYLNTPAFVSVNLRAGVSVTERVALSLALMNVLDRNYRIHGSGVDATGFNVFAGVSISY